MYRLKLQCRCGHQSNWKNFDTSESEIHQIIKKAQIGLCLPQHLVCPTCLSFRSVKPVVQKYS